MELFSKVKKKFSKVKKKFSKVKKKVSKLIGIKENKKFAIVYDFDKTLSTQYMHEYVLIKKLGFTNKEFWNKIRNDFEKNNMNSNIALLNCIKNELGKKNIDHNKFLNDCGKSIVFFKGLDKWFDHMNDYAKKINIDLEHYVVSSGNLEIIEGCSLYKYFKFVYASSYLFDNNRINDIRVSIDSFNKINYLIRVHLGIFNTMEVHDLPKKHRKCRVPYENMLYIGDGYGDVPSFEYIREKGGNAIAVKHSINSSETCWNIAADKQVSYVCDANYQELNDLSNLVKRILENS